MYGHVHEHSGMTIIYLCPVCKDFGEFSSIHVNSAVSQHWTTSKYIFELITWGKASVSSVCYAPGEAERAAEPSVPFVCSQPHFLARCGDILRCLWTSAKSQKKSLIQQSSKLLSVGQLSFSCVKRIEVASVFFRHYSVCQENKAYESGFKIKTVI